VVAEVASSARWLQRESAKQCGPCIHGLAAIAERSRSCAPTVTATALCTHRALVRSGHAPWRVSLPDGAASFVTSALHTFRPEFDDHAHYGGCDACLEPRAAADHARRTMPGCGMSESLRVDPIACTGHGLCAELFPERIWLDDGDTR